MGCTALNVPMVISQPCLYYTSQDVSMMVVPEEKWFESEVFDRVITDDTDKVYKIPLSCGKYSNISRVNEVRIILSGISEIGIENFEPKTIVKG